MTDRDPVTLAREVLDVQKAHENLCKRTGLPLPTSMDDMETLANAAPTLALQVEAVEKELSEAEEWLKSEGIGTSYEYGMDEMIRRIRATLALFDAHAAYHGDVIEGLREKWGDDA